MKEKRAPKPTKSEREGRITEVYKLLLSRTSRADIIEYCSNNWGLERAASDNLIQEASKLIQEELSTSRQTYLGIFLNNQAELYNKALQENQLQVARQVIMDSAKLLGLEQTTINMVVDDRRELETLSDDELDAILEAEKTH